MSIPLRSQARRQVARRVDRVVGEHEERHLALAQTRDERIGTGDRMLLADQHTIHVHQVGVDLARAGHTGTVASSAELRSDHSMLAAIYESSGGSAVLEVREVETPRPGPGEVRVKVAVSGVNPTDWKRRRTSAPAEGTIAIPNQDGAGRDRRRRRSGSTPAASASASGC